MTGSRFIPNIQRKICESLDLAFNTASLMRQWWSSHALGSILAKDASYGNAGTEKRKWRLHRWP